MIRPNIRIFNHDYDITEITDKKMDEISENWNALIEYREQKIKLRDGLKESQKEVGLAHEILHAMLSLTGTWRMLKDEETFIQALEQCFHSFLKENTNFYE